MLTYASLLTFTAVNRLSFCKHVGTAFHLQEEKRDGAGKKQSRNYLRAPRGVLFNYQQKLVIGY